MPVATPHTALSGQPGQSQPAQASSNGVNGNHAAAAAALNGTKNGVTPGSSIIEDILARRAKAGKLVAGIAAASDSDMWKGPVSHHPRPTKSYSIHVFNYHLNDTIFSNMQISKLENQRQSAGTVRKPSPSFSQATPDSVVLQPLQQAISARKA